jgi:GNS1/SUR4 family
MLLKASYILESVQAELTNRSFMKAEHMLIHHIIVPIMAWIIANYYPGGHVTIDGVINSFGHILNEFYFLVVILLNPSWKKHDKISRKVTFWFAVSTKRDS